MNDIDLEKLTDEELDDFMKRIINEKMIRTSSVWIEGKKYPLRNVIR